MCGMKFKLKYAAATLSDMQSSASLHSQIKTAPLTLIGGTVAEGETIMNNLFGEDM